MKKIHNIIWRIINTTLLFSNKTCRPGYFKKQREFKHTSENGVCERCELPLRAVLGFSATEMSSETFNLTP
jgi:hypothetical protein